MSLHLEPHQIEGFESLPGDARDVALAHLRDCGACRAAWIADEPSRVFALLSTVKIPEGRLEQLSERVAAEIDPGRARASKISGPARLYGAASIAASLLLAAVLGAVLWTRELPSEPIVRLEEVGTLLPLPLESMDTRLVALPQNDDSSWFDLNIGETQVLLIFDESIEL